MMIRRGVLALALLLSLSVAAAEELDTGRISVYGTAVRLVAPNQMRWHVIVRNIDEENARGAAKEHAAVVRAVLRYLQDDQDAAEDIQTSGMRLGENWIRELGSRVQEGYYASTDVTFTLTDLARYSEVWTALAELPSVSIAGVELDHSDRITYQNEARVDAVLAAKEKAQGIASALDARIGPALVVEEEIVGSANLRGRTPGPNNAVMFSGESDGMEDLVAPGSIPIRSRVKVVFALITAP